MMKTRANNDPAWTRRMAELEDGGEVTVGGLAQEVGMFDVSLTPAPVAKSAFAKLIELRRRELRLSVEQLAERAEVDIAELVGIELSEVDVPELRTVAKLAKVLKLPAQKLVELSGLATPKNARFAEAVVRFAAKSESIDKLSREEHEALEEFVKFLAES
jgi:HTH-type transcriptional regulator, competence development regulator